MEGTNTELNNLINNLNNEREKLLSEVYSLLTGGAVIHPSLNPIFKSVSRITRCSIKQMIILRLNYQFCRVRELIKN